MYTPHIATVINAEEGSGYTMSYRKTLLYGVFFETRKSESVGNGGMTDGDTATLYIPFNVSAIGEDGHPVEYIDASKYNSMEDKSKFWTIRPYGKSSYNDCFIIKGDVPKTDYSTATKTYEDVYRVSTIDVRDFGTLPNQHWQVGLR